MPWKKPNTKMIVAMPEWKISPRIICRRASEGGASLANQLITPMPKREAPNNRTKKFPSKESEISKTDRAKDGMNTNSNPKISAAIEP